MELTQEQRKQIESRFLGYISDYDPEDPKIRLKTDHSFRVAGLSERIAATEAAGLSGQAAAADTDMYGQAAAVDTDLAWLTGLLHDIGRFEQIRRYGTFVDARSVDHAALGADLLFQEGLLDRIAGPELASASEQTAGPEPTAQEREIMEISIRNHNRYRIEEDLPEQTAGHCHILRDADKIDIFRVLCDTPVEEIYDVTSDELRTAEVTEEVKECFRRRTAVPRPVKKTPVDNIVGHICLFFELIHPVSRRIALEQGYLGRLLGFSSRNEGTRQWFEYMRGVFETEQVAE